MPTSFAVPARSVGHPTSRHRERSRPCAYGNPNPGTSTSTSKCPKPLQPWEWSNPGSQYGSHPIVERHVRSKRVQSRTVGSTLQPDDAVQLAGRHLMSYRNDVAGPYLLLARQSQKQQWPGNRLECDLDVHHRFRPGSYGYFCPSSKCSNALQPWEWSNPLCGHGYKLFLEWGLRGNGILS